MLNPETLHMLFSGFAMWALVGSQVRAFYGLSGFLGLPQQAELAQVSHNLHSLKLNSLEEVCVCDDIGEYKGFRIWS